MTIKVIKPQWEFQSGRHIVQFVVRRGVVTEAGFDASGDCENCDTSLPSGMKILDRNRNGLSVACSNCGWAYEARPPESSSLGIVNASAAFRRTPEYFMWFYTAKSLALVAVTAALAYQLGKAKK